MSLMEVGLVNFLKADGPLNALISQRLYPRRLPEQAVMPAVTYTRVSTPRAYSHDGPSGLAWPRLQFDCWSDDYGEAAEVAHAVFVALAGFSGLMGTTKVRASFVENDRDDFQVGLNQHRRIVEAVIWHEEDLA